MQIEFSQLYGLMIGVNYAYYPAEGEQVGLHLFQIAAGLVMIQLTWTE